MENKKKKRHKKTEREIRAALVGEAVLQMVENFDRFLSPPKRIRDFTYTETLQYKELLRSAMASKERLENIKKPRAVLVKFAQELEKLNQFYQ